MKHVFEKIWNDPKNREYSPAEYKVGMIEKALKLKKGNTVLDVGCGTGRAAKELQEKGYSVTGIDIASNCLDYDSAHSFFFINSSAGDFRKTRRYNGVYAINTLECLEKDELNRFLRTISKTTNKFVCSISEHPVVIDGEEIHKTVMPPFWWYYKLKKYFKKVIPLDAQTFACYGGR